MPTITTKDGTQMWHNDWGTGQPVVFSHGWPLSADAFEDQMSFLISHGYRCIALDRRGHGRSSQPWNGNDMNTYADDLAALCEALNLSNAVYVGHSTGGGDDQIVPVVASALLSSKIVRNATLKVYPGAPHGMCATLKDQVNADLLAFIEG